MLPSMEFWARILVLLAFEAVLLVTPLMFPQIDPVVGYTIYGVAGAVLLIGGGYILKSHFWPAGAIREKYQPGYVKQRRGTPITTESMRRFIGFNTYVRWADREIARRKNLILENNIYDVDIIITLFSALGINTLEELEKQIRKNRGHVVRLTDSYTPETVWHGDSLEYLFYWIGAERGAEFLHKICKTTDRMHGDPRFYEDIVFARDQIKRLKNRSALSLSHPSP